MYLLTQIGTWIDYRLRLAVCLNPTYYFYILSPKLHVIITNALVVFHDFKLRGDLKFILYERTVLVFPKMWYSLE